MIKGTYPEAIKVLEKLKSQNLECFVISNWSSETFVGMVDDFPFLELFDGLLISGEEKLIKPDPKIFKLAINRFNLNPKNCVFIDDKLENVNVARHLDFKIIHLKNPFTIDADINNFL